jgi:inner membrane transporter RhtA
VHYPALVIPSGAPRTVAIPPWSLAVVAMLSIQLGAAWSLPLMSEIGAAGTSWLRLSCGALILLVIARPSFRSIHRNNVIPLVSLGVVIGVMTTSFLAAIERIPLGTTVAIEFLGPLTVAALRGGSWRAGIWPGVALAGVVMLTEPWSGAVDLVGIGFALLAALGWGLYILLTQKVGDQFQGIQGLALTTPIAAATAAIVGVPQAWGQIDLRVIVIACGLALLIPVIPYALEMLALKRMNPTAFGTLMAVEPGIALVIGLIILSQSPNLIQTLGMVLVVSAGVIAQRRSAREVSLVP